MIPCDKNNALSSVGYETCFYKTQFFPLLNKTSLLSFICFPSSSLSSSYTLGVWVSICVQFFLSASKCLE